jgi:Tfp pilus assembly major pilin PilA
MMVVVSIIAILALMAVPMYRDKYIREQVIEAMRLTDIAKVPSPPLGCHQIVSR